MQSNGQDTAQEADISAIALLEKELRSIKAIKSPPEKYDEVAKYRKETEKIIEDAVTTTQDIEKYANKINLKLNDIRGALMASTEVIKVAIKKTIGEIRNQIDKQESSLQKLNHLNELLAIESTKVSQISLLQKLNSTKDELLLEVSKDRLRDAIDQCDKVIQKIKSNAGFSLADLDNLKGCIHSWENQRKISYEQEQEQERRIQEERERKQREQEEKRKKEEEEKRIKEEERKKLYEEKLRKEEEEKKKLYEEKLKREEEERRRKLDPKNWKPIIFRRELDTNSKRHSFHQGICCTILAVPGSIRNDDIQCLASDEDRDLSSALKNGEKVLSSVITIDSKKGRLELEAPMRVFIPHHPITDTDEELTTKVSINGSDWVRSSVIQAPTASFTLKAITMSGLEIQTFNTTKVVVVARTRSHTHIIDRSGTNECPINEKDVKLFIPRDAFEQPTELNVSVKQVPENVLSELENGCDSYKSSAIKAGPIVDIEFQTPPKKDIELDILNSSDEVVDTNPDKSKPFHLYSTNEEPWKIVSRELKSKGKSRSVYLPAFKTRYRVQQIEAPLNTNSDRILEMANHIYDTMDKTVVRMIVKQNRKNHEQAIIQCVRRDQVQNRVKELAEINFNYGPDTSREFYLYDGQKVCITFTGNIEPASTENSQISLTFYAYMDSAKQEVVLNVKNEFTQSHLNKYIGNVHCQVLSMSSQKSNPMEMLQIDIPITLPKKEEDYSGMYGMGSKRRTFPRGQKR